MPVVTRFFSTTSAGTGDGTTWANRAALFSAGNWSSVITGFAFNGADSLACRIQGGLIYTCSQAMASGLFANAPSVANLLFFHGCDANGDLLSPPDPDWVSCQGEFNTSTLPVIATTTNIVTSSLANVFWRLVAFTASGRSGEILSAGNIDWCSFVNTTANTSARGLGNINTIRNSQVKMSGASFSAAIDTGAQVFAVSNVRIDGTAGTTSGNRIGINNTSAGMPNVEAITITGCAGGGMLAATGSAVRYSTIRKSMFVDNGTYGFRGNATASQTMWHQVIDSVFVNNVIGIDGQSQARILISNCRLRNNSTSNFDGLGNYPSDFGNDVTAGTNADEFVNAAAGDYRIKNTSSLWGRNLGPGDEPASGGGIAIGRLISGGV